MVALSYGGPYSYDRHEMLIGVDRPVLVIDCVDFVDILMNVIESMLCSVTDCLMPSICWDSVVEV